MIGGMRYGLGLFCCGVIGYVLFGASGASDAATTSELQPTTSPELVVATTSEVDVSAVAYGVFDLQTGEVLFGENLTEQRPIASITKLFTAATALTAFDSETEITVTAADIATEGRAGKLVAGQSLSVRELLFPLLLESSNDAAAALERQLGPITYENHPFADGSGLFDENLASVVELSSLTRSLYLSEPHIFDITRLSQYVGTETGWVNNSPVADLPGYRGGKHGYTTAANRTLVAIFGDEHLDGRELVYVILGSNNVRNDIERLQAAVVDSVELR